MKTKRKLGKAILTDGLLVIAVCVVLEVLCHIVGLPYHPRTSAGASSYSQFDQVLGWSYQPNTTSQQTYGSKKRPVELHFDRHGFRVANKDVELLSDRPSIVFIGGSYTMGHGLTYEESYVGQFERMVGDQYQVINAGVQAYGTDQALLMLEQVLSEFQAVLVIYTFFYPHIERNGIRDRRLLLPHVRFLGTKPLFKLRENGEPYLANPPLLFEDYTHSRLFDMIRMTLGKTLGTFPPQPIALTRALIDEMRQRTEAQGGQFIVVNWRWDDAKPLPDKFFEGHTLLDTFADAPEGWSEMRIEGDGHATEEAARIAAERLAVLVEEIRQ